MAVFGASLLAFATHAPLDNCTSYGTHLLWPFTDARTAWDCMSIIDPIFTLFLFLGVMAALIVGRPRPTRIGLALALSYITLGFIQHARVDSVQQTLADSRGHEIEFGRVMPSFGNFIVWRSVYIAEGRLHADSVHLFPWRGPLVREGTSVKQFEMGDLPIRVSSHVSEVVHAHLEFATGMATQIESENEVEFLIGDVRYSLDLGGFKPIWGVAIDTTIPGGQPRAMWFPTDRGDAIRLLWSEVIQPGPTWRNLEEIAPEVEPDR